MTDLPNPRGPMTQRVARMLGKKFATQALDVVYHHRQKEIDPSGSFGKLLSYVDAEDGEKIYLAELDIALYSRNDHKLIALIEIEETSTNAKLQLGDAVVPLLGDYVAFREKRLLVGPWTTMIVLSRISPKSRQGRRNRIKFLEQHANHLRSYLTTPNAQIGQLVMDNFEDEVELGEKLTGHIESAVKQWAAETSPLSKASQGG